MAKKAPKRRTAAELLRDLMELADDTESVSIPVMPAIQQTKLDGTVKILHGMGAVVKLCSGGTRIIDTKVAEQLINDGILQRMKIKIRLVSGAEDLG